MGEYRFRNGYGPEYVADIPDGTYGSLGLFLDDQGNLEETLHLRPTDGRPPFEVPLRRVTYAAREGA